ncbi:MAG TPA: prepilin peptidase [Burkholderiaceae bacterium]
MPFLPPLDLTACLVTAFACASDLRSRRIANELVLAALLSALLLQLASSPWQHALMLWSGGALTGLLLFLPLYVLRGMAAGDVKLMTAVGSLTGAATAGRIVLATCIAGGVLALIMLAARASHKRAWFNLRMIVQHSVLHVPRKHSAGTLPYAVAIAVGTWLVLLFR